jgi:hypothetical protein
MRDLRSSGSPWSQRFKRQKNAVVGAEAKKTTQCNASVNARRVGRSAYFGRTVWVVLLQTQMAERRSHQK